MRKYYHLGLQLFLVTTNCIFFTLEWISAYATRGTCQKPKDEMFPYAPTWEMSASGKSLLIQLTSSKPVAVYLVAVISIIKS